MLFSTLGAAESEWDFEGDFFEGLGLEEDGEIKGAPESKPEPATQAQPAVVELAKEELPALPPRPGGRIEEIIVTAQKRSQNLREVPISISAFSEDFLDEAGISNFDDLSQHTPNAVINVRPSLGYLTIRGLGSGLNAGLERSVALIVDGVYLGRQEYLSDALIDVGRVEVLRGPQGTLFGKNAIAGAFNIVSKGPSEEWTGDLSALYGDNSNRQRLRLAAGGPISESLLARVALERHRDDGPIANTTAALDTQDYPNALTADTPVRSLDNSHARVSLLLPNLLADLTLSLSSYFGRIRSNGIGLELIEASPNTLEVYRRHDPATEDQRNRSTALNESEGAQRNSQLHILNAQYEMESFDLTAIVGWSGFDNATALDGDFGPIDAVLRTTADRYRQGSVELRLTSPPGALEYQMGVYGFRSDLSNFLSDSLNMAETAEILAQENSGQGADLLNALLPLLPPEGVAAVNGPLANLRDFDQITQSRALFGQATWHWSPSWSITAGLRYTVEDKRVHAVLDHSDALASVVFRQFLNEEAYDERRQRQETDLSPKLSLGFAPNDDVNLYLSYARAFKAGGYNAFAQSPDSLEYEPEHAASWEAGIKTRLLDGNASLNLAVFTTSFDNLQVSVFNGLSFVVGNAASSTSQGLELEGSIGLTPWLLLTGSGAFLDATYDSFTGAPCPATSENEACDISGRSLSRAPRYEFALSPRVGLDRLFPAVANHGWSLSVGLDWLYRDHQFLTSDLDPADGQDAYTEWNAFVRWGAIDERWSLTLFGRNLSDSTHLIGAQDVTLQPGSHTGAVAAARRLQAEFSLSW